MVLTIFFLFAEGKTRVTRGCWMGVADWYGQESGCKVCDVMRLTMGFATDGKQLTCVSRMGVARQDPTRC